MPVQHATLEQLQTTHRGAIITPDDPRYDEGRRVWNAMIDRRPAVIVRCRSAADVMSAVNYGRDNALPIAVRGGAHGIAGMGTCNDGLVIDFADMKGIRVDRRAQTVRAEPGLRWTEFDRETQAFGLATTGGTIGDTGIAGLTLGGGFGWLEGRFGMTVDNVVGADLVLASGELVHASGEENSDLFWAIRGGGGNFGVVTSFEYRLHQVGPMIVGGLVIHPFSAATDLLRFYRDLLRDAPDELTPAAVLLTLPDGNKGCAIAVAYSGAVADGERIVQSIKSFGRPVMDAMGPIPYLGQQSMLEQAMPPNLRNYWKADFVATVSDEVIETAVNGYAQAVSPLSSILFFPIHGAAARVPKDATAFPHRGGIHMGIYSLWNDPAQDAPNVQWVRRVWDAVQPHIPGGVYVNELGEDDGNDRVRQAYGANYTRLAKIKAKYDPKNLFRLNANILPSN